MASNPAQREHFGAPLAAALAVIPSLPRPLLNRIVERAIEHMDQIDGDPDFEDNHDQEAIDEREPEHDAEIDTWAHPDDHPAELFLGRRVCPTGQHGGGAGDRCRRCGVSLT
jgi:hypothetical protein